MSLINFSLLIKDYDSLDALSNKKIEITNNDTNKTYPTKVTDSRGIVTFSIDDKEKGDFFSVKLVGDTNYSPIPYNLAKDSNDKELELTKKVLTPNNYQNHQCILYFKSNISLLFNGNKLCLLQGKKIISSYDAKSGKELSIEEKSALQRENNYKSFIRHRDLDKTNLSNNIAQNNTKEDSTSNKENHKSKDSNNTLDNNISTLTYCCIDSNYQKDKDGVIPEGKYYIDTKNININTDSINIYTDKECNNKVESKTKRKDFILKKSNVKTNNNGDITISKNNGIIFSKIQYCAQIESNIPLDVIYSKKGQNQATFMQQTDQGIEIDSNYLNLEAPFAPGTYITLEAKSLADIEYVMWGYIIARSQDELDEILNEEKAVEYDEFIDIRCLHTYNNYFEKNGETHKIAFSLPMRDTEEFDKYYVIVFAYDCEIGLPSINDPFIVIDMSFRVGEGEDDEIIEAEREMVSIAQHMIYNQTSIENLSAWNKIETIYNSQEAVDFLQANIVMAMNKKLNSLDYYKAYPQLAGKIAYIYYRFDLNNEEFIRSNDEDYVNNVDLYANEIANVYNNKGANLGIPHLSTYNLQFKKAFFDDDSNIDQEKLLIEFIKDIGDALNIKQEYLPKIDFDPSSGRAGVYNSQTNTLSTGKPTPNDDSAFMGFIDTIVHEFRHFYIDYIFKYNKEHQLYQVSLAQLIYYNTKIYASFTYEYIFNAYDKQCADCDIFEDSIFKKGESYLSSDSQSAPIYYLQPSERDARVAAYKFRKNIGMVA